MTGLERNADVVRMASYAPMFAKYGNTQWSAADMIWFNNSDYVLTPNYYVQSLFSKAVLQSAVGEHITNLRI